MISKYRRVPWVFIFVATNLIASGIILNTGELLGDLKGFSLYSNEALIWATILVVSSFILILGPLFNILSKLKVKPWGKGGRKDELPNRIGKFLIVLQLTFIAFNLHEGVNIAGSGTVRSDNILSYLWVALPADALFAIYYGEYRESKLFRPNLIIYLISNLLRGWAGIFLFIIFAEWCRAAKNNNIKFSRVVAIGISVLAMYPLLSNFKWIVRASSDTGFSVDAFIDGFILTLNSYGYMELMQDGVMHLISRVQSVSLVVETMRLSDLLQNEFSQGYIKPFWREGLHALIFEKLFFKEGGLPIGIAFTNYNFPDGLFEVGSWNISIGYVSWFFVAPYFIPLYLAYTVFLGFISIFILKKMGASVLSKDILWFYWLVYIMAPWHAAFVGYIYALLVFLILTRTLAAIPKYKNTL